jgi:DNA-binding PadR family transcriptional regulator
MRTFEFRQEHNAPWGGMPRFWHMSHGRGGHDEDFGPERGPEHRLREHFERGEHGPRFERGPRGPRSPRGERRGPRVGRGDVRAATLLLLAEQPLHGYQIIQLVSERSGGIWQPSPGSVYPALQLLEDEGFVLAEQNEGRRVFQLTESGKAYVEENRDKLNTSWKAVTDTEDDGSKGLRDLFLQIGHTIKEVTHVGTAAQIASAQKLLVNTRRQLYRILAEDDITE